MFALNKVTDITVIDFGRSKSSIAIERMRSSYFRSIAIKQIFLDNEKMYANLFNSIAIQLISSQRKMCNALSV